MLNKTIQSPVLNLGPLEQIPLGEGKTFQAGLLPVAVFRSRSGKLYATQAFCPHREALLADGIIGEGKVICPLHAYKFDLETGKPLGNECASLKTYRVILTPEDTLQLYLGC